ncbi:MAG: putative molybdenum carrier protein [Bacteroidia bacterium]|nr:putative molybdenum carrier protein [Bacteroidia bacterium]
MSKIISGGQTGVDRAALDIGINKQIPIGGYCPKGRLAEDGIIDAKYPLIETPLVKYEERTEWNVNESDGTLVLKLGEITGGTAFTIECLVRIERPYLVVDLQNDREDNITLTTKFLEDNSIDILNIAGPRESSNVGVYAIAFSFLNDLFGQELNNS